MSDHILIGIAGGSGSGKTTVAARIGEELKNDDVLILGQDSYYLDNSHLPMEDRVKVNYDHPDAFDTELLSRHLDDLKSGRAIEQPIYNYATHSRMSDVIKLEPARVVILEGILVLFEKALRSRMDIKIFVDAEADVRLIRRIQRDVTERGRSLMSVLNQYEDVVRKMHGQFVEPSKRYADIIVPKGGHNDVAIDMITTKIRAVLSTNRAS